MSFLEPGGEGKASCRKLHDVRRSHPEARIGVIDHELAVLVGWFSCHM